MRDIISNICEITPKNYYNWKGKSHTILIRLLESYFSENELLEFLKTGKIKKLDHVNSYLKNLKIKCDKIYVKIAKMEIEHKNSNVDYELGSIFFSRNLYISYLSPFLRKHEKIVENFKAENFKADFITLVLDNPFEFKSNGIPEPLVTFQILSILDELSSSEMHYFFNEYDKIVHDIE